MNFLYRKKIEYNILINKILIILILIFYIIGYYGRKNIRKISKTKLINKNIRLIDNNKLKNFISYSQFLEDLILFSFLYEIKRGFYIDIGANDPDEISVTKAFYLRGWSGINIEPLPEKYKSLSINRVRDINLQIGIGDKKGNSILYLMKKGSTTSNIYSNNQTKTLNITIDTMKSICEKYLPKGKEIDFCKIDIEGDEKNALLGFDFENYRPKIFCIESTKPGTNIPCFDNWEYILLRNDYSFVYEYKINRYYVDNTVYGLKEKLFYVQENIKNYKIKYHK